MKRGPLIIIFLLGVILILSLQTTGAIECVPGIYNSTYFCNITGEFEELKPDYDECLNDYECIAGSCVYNGAGSYCEPKYKEIKEQTNILQTFFDNIVAFFSGIFTGIFEREAPAAETGVPQAPINLHAVYDAELNVVNLTWGRSVGGYVYEYNAVATTDPQIPSCSCDTHYGTLTCCIGDVTNPQGCSDSNAQFTSEDVGASCADLFDSPGGDVWYIFTRL